MADFSKLQNRIGYQFRDENLLRLALVHPSLTHENSGTLAHNQRLEFLGDSVLELVLTHALYEKFPEADEGLLTKSRARLVNASALAQHAGALDLGEQLFLSRGEAANGGRQRASLLADAFEALLGAIFLDGGFEAVQKFILRECDADLALLAEPSGIENPKGELQELLQSRSPHAPIYELIAASGPDHDRNFECAVRHNGVDLARGTGKSKKSAESEAALAALKKLREPS